jgi:hypothetical protein
MNERGITVVLFETGVDRTWENGQHDNGYIIQ